MLVGTLNVAYFLPACRSLKERRSVVNSLKERVRARSNASVSEVDAADLWQRATLAVAIVGDDGAHISQQLDAAMRILESDPRAQVLDVERELR